MQARTPCGTCDMEDRHDRPLHRAVKNLSSVRLAHQPIPSGLNPPGSRRGCPKTAARLPHDAKRYHETLVILVPLDSSKEESDMVSSSLFFQVLSLLNHQNKTFLDTRVLHHPSSECLQSDSNGWRTGLQIPRPGDPGATAPKRSRQSSVPAALWVARWLATPCAKINASCGDRAGPTRSGACS